MNQLGFSVEQRHVDQATGAVQENTYFSCIWDRPP